MDYIRKIHLALLLVTLLTLHVRANTETINGYTWKYRINGDTAEIYDGGYECAISPAPTGKVCIPQFLGGKPVTKIGDSSFIFCTELTDVEIPDSVTAIDVHSFEGCTALMNVTIGHAVTNIKESAFSNCTNLKNVIVSQYVCDRQLRNVFPHSYMSSITNVVVLDGVEHIGQDAFYRCHKLAGVTIPEGVVDVGQSAFYGCASLERIKLPESLRSIGDRAFCMGYDNGGLKEIMIPDNVVDIGGGAFSSCSLTNVVIGNSVTNIGRSAFSYCYALDRIEIPGSVTRIGDYAFWLCKNLREIILSDGLLSIGENTFNNCSHVSQIVIPSSVTNISGAAFAACSALTSSYVPIALKGKFEESSVFENCNENFVIKYYEGENPFTCLNDNFADADDFGAASGLSGDNSNATAEEGEPLTNLWENATTTVWWKWTAPEDGTATFDTVGSSFDTVMGVYVGESLGNLSVVAEDDDGAGAGNLSAVTFQATSGTTYHICVAGYRGATGDITINRNFSAVAKPQPPSPVVSLSATEDGPGVIRVSWGAPTETTATGYKVYRATRPNFDKAMLVTVLSDKWSLSYDDTDVSVDPTYYYWISAFNDVGESEVAGPVIGYCEEPLQIETSSLPVATELVEYETAILPEYDSGHLNWHVEYDEYGNPMLPDGLDMSSDGIISGCPTQAGTYTFTVSCCDTRFGVSVSKELTLTVAENPNRKPVVTAAEPVLGTDVVISNGTSQLFKVTASDPDGKGITYRWVVDGEEVSSGTQNSYRLRTSEDEPGTSHEVVCYVNDDLWTDFVACRWTVYVPNELHVSTDDGEWALINAIWDSAPYDTIHVAPGTYSADIWIQHPLTIVATDGPLQTKLEGTIEFNTDERALGKIAVLRGFTLTEYGYHKGYSDLSLERCIVAESGGGWEHWYEDEYDEEEDSEDVQERGILLHCTLTRCTIAANVADPEVLPLMVGCEYGGDTVIWGNEGAENDASDPMFVDAANGDYRLRTISPHVIDGTATKGALDEVVDGFVISASVVGVGALDKMTAVVSPGGNATFAVATGSHPLDHFEVNGNSVSGIGNAYTFSNVLSDATLTAVFVSNVTFYVDAANGNDVNDGFTKASAVATLQEAVNRAVDGDTVRVADGTYEPVFTAAKHIVIESANGYKTTVIDGGGTNGCVNVGYNPSGSFPPTISTNTVIRGFTLTNGRAFHGGGIIGGIAERCLVRNCVAFNEGPGHSAAFVYGEGGGAYCSTLRYCTIVENTAEFWPGYEWECDPYTTGGEGGGTYACTLEHCIVWNNTAEVTPDDDGSLCYVTCFEDPGFVDISNGDMRIDATSPWVVAGRATVGCEPDVEITSKPAQPQWNDVTCGNATDGVHLSWTGAGDQASYWVIYRADEEEYGYERLAHVDEPTYVDTTAVQDVHYWYWVEGYNKKGRSEESELAEGWCVAPLSVPDLAMPTGTVGRGYSVEFVAAGGNGEGCWWEQIGRGYDVERVNDTGHFMKDRGEETAIGGEYVLPFDFPVCDTSIRSVTIGDGNLSGGMENGLGWIELYPYWSQNDDFTLWVEWDRCAVRSQPDGVCFTWWTHYSYETWLEVTLYADGRIRYRYSGAAVRGQVVPQLYMFHEDDIGNGYEFRPWPDCAEIVTSGTGYLFVPQSDGDLPPGISCDDDGFSGVPETNGVWAVRMRVHDWLHPDAVWSDAVFDIAIEKPQPYHPESEYYDDFVLWLEENGLLSSADSATEDDVYEAATKTEPGGKPFWHDFVTGANPLETNDVFHATISIENGEVEVSWSPQLSAAEAAKRVYTIYGSTELPSSGDAEWTPIPDGTDKSAYRFFKVGVEMR